MNAQAGLRLSVERRRRSWGGGKAARIILSSTKANGSDFRRTVRILRKRIGLEAYGSDLTDRIRSERIRFKQTDRITYANGSEYYRTELTSTFVMKMSGSDTIVLLHY